MSVHVTSWVLKHSPVEGAARLVLLVLADHAREDGTEAWPSIESIVRDSRVSERYVQRCLRRLEDVGAIERTGTHRANGQRGFGTYVYRVVMVEKGGEMTTLLSEKGGTPVQERVVLTPPDTSLEPPYEEVPNGTSSTAVEKKPRARDVVWDACDAVWGAPSNDVERSRRSRVVKLLRQSLAGEDLDAEGVLTEVRARFENYRARYGGIAPPSDVALVSRWSECAQPPPEPANKPPPRRYGYGVTATEMFDQVKAELDRRREMENGADSGPGFGSDPPRGLPAGGG